MSDPTTQKWEGRWDQLVGRVKGAWGKLTDDEITSAEGDYEKLLGLLKEKTGETREKIEAEINRDPARI